MIKWLIILAVFMPGFLQAGIMEDFDSIGGNKDLLDKAKALQPETEIRVVQDRIVPRRLRHELGFGYENFIGGDAYVRTQTLGVGYHFHLNPRWSLGAKYFKAFNTLSQEGDALINNDLAQALPEESVLVPDLDPMDQGYMATVNWYPIYGKFNLYDLGVVHFDAYLLAGYGQVQVQSGDKDSWSTGIGVGLWFSQHLTARFEMRYQTYEVNRFVGGTQDMDLTVANFSIGFMP